MFNSAPRPNKFAPQCARDFDDFVNFELITLFDVVESFDRQSAFEPCLDLAHVILEALERIELAIVDDDIGAQDPDLRTAADDAFEHVAAGDSSDLGYLVYLAHFDEPELAFLLLRREHARERRLHLVHRLVDDVVVANVDAVVLGELARGDIGAGVEADDDGLRRQRQVDVRLGNAADGGMHDVDLDLRGRELRQRTRQRLVASLHVGLDDQRECLDLVLGPFGEHVLELRRLLLGELDVAELALTEQRDFARLAFVAQDHDLFAGERNIGQALDFDGNRGAGTLHALAGLVGHRAHAPKNRAGEHDVAALQRSRVNEHGRERTLALVEAGFNHDSLRQRIARRLELEHFGLQQYRVEQIVDALPGLCRYLDELCLAAVFLGQHAFGDEFLLDAVGIRFRLVDLVDSDDDGHAAGLGVRNRDRKSTRL